MVGRRRSWVWALLAAELVAGCGRPPAPPADTGAREAAQDFYEALLRRDWPGAYAAVDADSRARCGAGQFARLAENYHRGLGFGAQAVYVRSCEEQGARAVAHVVWTRQGAGGQRYYKDAVTLRQTGTGWSVILPANFGRAPSR